MRILFSFLFSLLLFVSSGHTATLSCGQFYGVPSARIQPADRFAVRLEGLRKALANKTSEGEIVEALAKEHSRTLLLQLQALPKVIEASDYSADDIKNALAFRKEIKVVEGQIGYYVRQIELFERTSPTSVSPELVAYLKNNVELSKQQLIVKLKESGWLPDPNRRIDSLLKRVSKVDFKGRKKDQKRQVKALLDLMSSTREEIADLDRYFYKEKFDHEDLELGLHTMRRALRWMSVIVSASDGLYYYEYSPNSSPETQALEAKYGSSKYLKLKTDPEISLPLNRGAMIQITRLVTELGVLKDYRESQLDLNDALLVGKFISSAKKAAAFAELRMAEHFGTIDVESAARALFEEYLAKDPLKILRQDLRRALKDNN